MTDPIDAIIEASLQEAIERPNSSGQGYDPDHAKNPYHETILKHGYAYSHTTPVKRAGVAMPHHTYKHAELGPDFNVSVFTRSDGNPAWSTGRGGYGREYVGGGVRSLDWHLRRHVARMTKRYGK